MQQLGEFILNHWLLFLALLIIITLLIMSGAKQQLLGFQEVKPAAAVDLINHDDAVVIDTRSQEEFHQGHIINALNIPFEDLDQRLDELNTYREQSIIICCKTGQKSAKAGSIFKKSGFAKIYKLEGGMLAWNSANLPIIATHGQ